MSNISDGGLETMVRSQSGPRLVAQQGSERGKSFAIPPTGLLVGRAGECNLTLDDVEVSRRHARFYWHGSRLLVEDLGSANGTVVNGRPISGAQPLNERDLVGIGNSVFIVQGLISQELTPTARNLDAAAPAIPPRYAPPPPQAAPAGGTFWLVIIGLGLAALVAILGLGAFWYFSQTPSVAQAPVVTIINPANGAQVELNVPLIVQATASDSRGVTRMELWADGTLVTQQASPSSQGASPLLLNMTWTPTVPGSHFLEVRAFNTANRQSTPALITVNVAAGTATATSEIAVTETPTPTATDNPTATAPAIILFTVTPSPTSTSEPESALQAIADVNVRGGPGTNYPVLGLLRAGDTVEVMGRSPEGAWWQIIFPPNTGALGWVVGTYVQPNAAAGDAPIVAGPPLPPTNTPITPLCTRVSVPGCAGR
ncbi:MAG: FHA domain-containing protein [Chloroflexi bacterium]|nr:FHA domain-containing protein [Chloroflexota bacterium]